MRRLARIDARTSFLDDVERSLHDLGADSVAIGDPGVSTFSDRDVGGHACELTKIPRGEV
jgi:hypothetical protein